MIPRKELNPDIVEINIHIGEEGNTVCTHTANIQQTITPALPNASRSSACPGASQIPDPILHSTAPKVYYLYHQDDPAVDFVKFDL